jgi:hypothetical protein
MTFTRPTFSDCQQSLSYRYGETTLPTTGVSNRNFWINKAVEYMSQFLFKKKNTAVVSSGSVTLPDNFRAIYLGIIYSSDKTKFKQISEDDQMDYTSEQVFWISGNPTEGYKLNTFTDDTFTYFYTYFPSPMTQNTDVCIIPDIEAVSAYAYAYLRKSQTDPLGDADKSLQEADNRLKDMIYNENQNSDGLVFGSIA